LTEQDLRAYFAAFNRNDFDAVAQYYADDMVFEGRGRHFKSREEMVNFYRGLKSRIRETVTLLEVVVGENAMVVEIQTELDAFEDWLAMPTGPMRKGDRIRSRNFVWYEIANNKFAHLRSAGFRRLGPSEPSSLEKPFDPLSSAVPPAMSKERFAAYIDALNNDDYAALGDYYTDDALSVPLGKKELRGRQAILDFYRLVKGQTKSTVRINKVITSGNPVAAELQSELAALDDLPDFITGPMKKGSHVSIIAFVLYNVRDGKFSWIRSAEFRRIERP